MASFYHFLNNFSVYSHVFRSHMDVVSESDLRTFQNIKMGAYRGWPIERRGTFLIFPVKGAALNQNGPYPRAAPISTTG